MTNDDHETRPAADLCDDPNCGLCHPRAEGRAVALSANATIELQGTGKVAAAVSLAGIGHLTDADSSD